MDEDNTLRGRLLSLLECPVCFNYMLPPLEECDNGHLICQVCVTALNRCPTCRGRLKGHRNRSMEKVAELLNFPCKYQVNGCTEALAICMKREHERWCSFSDNTSCPLADCQWSGLTIDMDKHLREEHDEEINSSEDGHFSATLEWVGNESAVQNTWYIFDSTLFRIIIERSILDQSVIINNEIFSTVYAHVEKLGGINRKHEYGYFISVDEDGNYSNYQGLVTFQPKDLSELAAYNNCLCFVHRSEDDEGDLIFEGQVSRLS